MVNLDNLFLRIKELNLTAKKVSDDTGISTGNISDWKSGRSMPTAIKLDVLANYLDCSVDYLLGRTDDQHTNNISHSSVNVVRGDNSGTFTSSISTSIGEKKDISKEENEILNIYRSLEARDRTKFMNFVFEMEDKINKA